jgi:hypothetical protein
MPRLTSLRAFAAPVIVFMAGYLFPHAMKSITYSKHHRSRVNPFVSKTRTIPRAAEDRPRSRTWRAPRACRRPRSAVRSATPTSCPTRTRAAVMDAIRTTGYRVNQAARNLRMQRAGAVLILVPNLGKPFYSRILAGISDGFADSDYAVLIADTESRPLREGELLDYFLDGRIDGVISLDGGPRSPCVAGLRRRGPRRAHRVSLRMGRGADFPVIRADNAEGARLAIRHLHGLGHTRIAHVTGTGGQCPDRGPTARHAGRARAPRPADPGGMDHSRRFLAGIGAPRRRS